MREDLMSFNQKTHDNILNGSLSVIQYKKGFRFGSDAVFLASFVNGFIETKKNRKFYIADVGSGVGTVSLIIAFRNPNSKILAIDNKREYLDASKRLKPIYNPAVITIPDLLVPGIIASV